MKPGRKIAIYRYLMHKITIPVLTRLVEHGKVFSVRYRIVAKVHEVMTNEVRELIKQITLS